MGNCQDVLDSQKEIIFDTQFPKKTLNYQKLNKTIIFEYSYIKYHHPIPVIINHSVETPSEYYADMLLSTMVGVEVMWCFDEQGRSLAEMMEDAILVTAIGLTGVEEHDGE